VLEQSDALESGLRFGSHTLPFSQNKLVGRQTHKTGHNNVQSLPRGAVVATDRSQVQTIGRHVPVRPVGVADAVCPAPRGLDARCKVACGDRSVSVHANDATGVRVGCLCGLELVLVTHADVEELLGLLRTPRDLASVVPVRSIRLEVDVCPHLRSHGTEGGKRVANVW
jgi:hypothetical protein